jgi:hypothetical protein
MSNSNEKENEKWRKFLQPVITGLVAMMTAVVGYLQYLQKQESDKRDSRIAVLEVQVNVIIILHYYSFVHYKLPHIL